MYMNSFVFIFVVIYFWIDNHQNLDIYIDGDIVKSRKSLIFSETYHEDYLSNASEIAKCEQGERRFPDCIIIGVQKGGTTALLRFLSAHPQVVTNNLIPEYHFFDYRYERGLKWYRDNMPCSLPGQIVIECTPRYFRTPDVPKRVFEMDPNIRLLLIVRNPVQRAMSMYYMYKRFHEKPDKLRIISAEKFREHGMYSKINMSRPFESTWENFLQVYDSDLENWLNCFNLEQIHIIDSEAYTKSPAKELEKTEDFLRIEHYFEEKMFVYNPTKGFYCLRPPGSQKHCLDKEKGHQHPNISLSVLRNITEYSRPHNERFYQLSGKHFNWD